MKLLTAWLIGVSSIAPMDIALPFIAFVYLKSLLDFKKLEFSTIFRNYTQ